MPSSTSEVVRLFPLPIANSTCTAARRAHFVPSGLEPLWSTPDELANLMKTETLKWAKVIKDSGATVD